MLVDAGILQDYLRQSGCQKLVGECRDEMVANDF